MLETESTGCVSFSSVTVTTTQLFFKVSFSPNIFIFSSRFLLFSQKCDINDIFHHYNGLLAHLSWLNSDLFPLFHVGGPKLFESSRRVVEKKCDTKSKMMLHQSSLSFSARRSRWPQNESRLLCFRLYVTTNLNQERPTCGEIFISIQKICFPTSLSTTPLSSSTFQSSAQCRRGHTENSWENNLKKDNVKQPLDHTVDWRQPLFVFICLKLREWWEKPILRCRDVAH